MNTKAKQNGFTIIEVVLVLAIAALIFLMIFIAWPALQRGQRDTARKNDANVVASAIGTWRSNHNGKLPTITELQGAIDSLSQYDKSSELIAGSGPSDSQMGVTFGSKCNSSLNGVVPGSTRQAAIMIKLEGQGGATQPFCQDA